jgi:tetratricopeptide (TPR) repeat protein
VEEMDRPEAINFLKKTLIRKQLLDSETITTELLDELTYLPLAIAQAAAYLNTNKNTSISSYLQLLRNTEQGMISLMSREFRDNTRYKESSNAIARTWLLSFEQIRHQDPIAAEILSFISCIEPKAIPHSILPQGESEERQVRAIGTLCGYSFMVKRGEEDIYDIHRLVHLATNIWVQRHGTIEVLKKAIKHVSHIFPHHYHDNRLVWRPYLIHTLRLLKERPSEDVDDIYILCYKVGQCLYGEGRNHEAISWLEESYQWGESKFKEKPTDLLYLPYYLARAYIEKGLFKKAIDMLELIVTANSTKAEDHPDRLESQNQLAIAYLNDGQAKKSIELVEHIVTIRARMHAEKHQID